MAVEPIYNTINLSLSAGKVLDQIKAECTADRHARMRPAAVCDFKRAIRHAAEQKKKYVFGEALKGILRIGDRFHCRIVPFCLLSECGGVKGLSTEKREKIQKTIVKV